MMPSLWVASEARTSPKERKQTWVLTPAFLSSFPHGLFSKFWLQMILRHPISRGTTYFGNDSHAYMSGFGLWAFCKPLALLGPVCRNALG